MIRLERRCKRNGFDVLKVERKLVSNGKYIIKQPHMMDNEILCRLGLDIFSSSFRLYHVIVNKENVP